MNPPTELKVGRNCSGCRCICFGRNPSSQHPVTFSILSGSSHTVSCLLRQGREGTTLSYRISNFLISVLSTSGVNRRPIFFWWATGHGGKYFSFGTAKPRGTILLGGHSLFKHPVCTWHCSRLIHVVRGVWARFLLNGPGLTQAFPWQKGEHDTFLIGLRIEWNLCSHSA